MGNYTKDIVERELKSFDTRLTEMTDLERDIVVALCVTLNWTSSSFLANTEIESNQLIPFIRNHKLLVEPTRERLMSKMRTMTKTLKNLKKNVSDYYSLVPSNPTGGGRPPVNYSFTREGIIYFFNSFGPNSPKADLLKLSFAKSVTLVDDIIFNMSATEYRRSAFMAVMDHCTRTNFMKCSSTKALDVLDFVLATEPVESCKQISDRVLVYNIA